MAVANVMGSSSPRSTYWGPNFDTLPEVGATDRSFNYLFVGAAPTIVLLWLGIAGGGEVVRRGRRLLTGAAARRPALHAARYTPVYALAFEHVPGISRFAVQSTVHSCSWPCWRCWPASCAGGLCAGRPAAAAALGELYAIRGVRRPVRDRLGHLVLLTHAARLGFLARGAARNRDRADRRGIAHACPLRTRTRHCGDLRQHHRRRRALWWNAASTLNAEPPGYYSVLERPAGGEAHALAILEREIAARRKEGERPRVEIVGVSGPSAKSRHDPRT